MRSSTRSTIEALAPVALAEESRPTERVRELVAQAQKDYDIGRFDKAIDGYSKAYAEQPMPALLFNLGQCHRQQGDLERAGFFYRR